jgi:hypothetical protein
MGVKNYDDALTSPSEISSQPLLLISVVVLPFLSKWTSSISCLFPHLLKQLSCTISLKSIKQQPNLIPLSGVA